MAEKKPAKGPKTFYMATGRRKTAVARVRVTEGKGAITINDRPLDAYFTEEKDRAAVLGPLKVTDQLGRLDVIVKATGGGITGQAGAVCQGLARAIKTMFSPADEQKGRVFNQTTVIRAKVDEKKAREQAKAHPVHAPTPTPTAIAGADGAAATADVPGGMNKKLRDSGYLTRDARMKERKKYGLRGARRGTQFSKR
jgi:small subunit ribosomal protein S9